MEKKRLSSECTLMYLIEILTAELKDVNELQEAQDERSVFYGMKSVYVEVLEILQQWDRAESCGLNFDIESKYPV